MQDWQKEILNKEKFNKNGLDKFQPLKTQTMKKLFSKDYEPSQKTKDTVIFLACFGIVALFVITIYLVGYHATINSYANL